MTIIDRFLKRIFDILASVAGLLLLWPVMALVALSIRLSDGGSAFFRQARVGKEGQVFSVIKFRTMQLNHGVGSTVTIHGDKRVTGVGSFLRRWKLDELPQLWNILKGEMSFVGPRPDVPGFADRLVGEDRIILKIRPGITGPATLKYRNEEELLAAQPDPERYNITVIFPDKVRLNRDYVKNYSLTKDIKYIFKTLLG